jgi:glycosyltransferase involved in cell wall biosynthesis
VDTTVFSPHLATKERYDARTVISLGRKDPNKRFADLLEAVRILNRQFSDLRLLIATQDRELVVNAPVSTEIVCPADDEELARYYRRADVFALPSLQEGFGLPPLEAMACGVPVVTTDCGGVSDFAEDGINCLVVPVKDPQTMAEAMRRILDDRDLAKRFSEAGRKTACQFTWDRMVDKFESLLTSSLHK